MTTSGDWYTATQRQLHFEHCAVLERLCALLLERGDIDEAVTRRGPAAADRPVPENRSSAADARLRRARQPHLIVQQFRRCEITLRRELSVGLSEATVELYPGAAHRPLITIPARIKRINKRCLRELIAASSPYAPALSAGRADDCLSPVRGHAENPVETSRSAIMSTPATPYPHKPKRPPSNCWPGDDLDGYTEIYPESPLLRAYWDSEVLDTSGVPSPRILRVEDAFDVRFRLELRGPAWQCMGGGLGVRRPLRRAGRPGGLQALQPAPGRRAHR